MPCNDKNYLARYAFGMQEHVNMENQDRFPFPKSKVLVKNLLFRAKLV